MPAKIEKRGANTYLLTVAMGYDEHGKQLFRRKRVTASSDRDASRQYNLFAAEVLSGEVAGTGKCKLTEFARHWYKRYCEKALAPKTQQSYKNHLEKRILPALGHIDINKLRPLHIMQFLDDLRQQGRRYDNREHGLSDETIRYSFRVLSSMLQDAVQWQVIPSNPCERVKPPSASHTKIPLLSEDEVKAMLTALEGEPLKYRTIILGLSLFTMGSYLVN